MPIEQDARDDDLLRRIGAGDRQAMDQLLSTHRDRLRASVGRRMDRRLASRVAASDVVQEALIEAARRLPEFVQQRRMPFSLWLWQIARQRLVDLFRRHFRARSRSVQREEALLPLADDSTSQSAGGPISPGASPSEDAIMNEDRDRLQVALAKLPASDRELLVLRYVEQRPPKETAAALGITERALRARHRRAFERLQQLLTQVAKGEEQ